MVKKYDTDILNITDFRLPGGTTHSVAEEVRAQSNAGYRTHLVHAPSPLVGKSTGWVASITDVGRHPLVTIVSGRTTIHAQLIVIRHPTVIEKTTSTFSGLSADKVVIVANNAAVDGSGDFYYDVEAVDRKVHALFGVRPLWAPIGPVVVEGIKEQGADVEVSAENWLNLLAPTQEADLRTRFVGDRPVIGRHSRPQSAKWPATREDILAAYPDDGSVDVEILGGAGAVLSLMDSIPESWNVVPFGGEEPHKFLGRIDFWVYFHHPDWREAYGRSIMEALFSGAVVILPHYLKDTYGDAAIYAEPHEVSNIVHDLYSDLSKFLAQSRRGQDFVNKHDSSIHLERLKSIGVYPNSGQDKRQIFLPGIAPTRKRRILFATSNGAGMGHLTRLLSVATRLPDNAEPVFASLSSAVDIVGRYGIPYEYIASRDGLGMESKTWNRYSRTRFRTLLEAVDPDTIVFDGTWPYPGLRESFQRTGTHAVWMRRAMWKRDTTTRPLGWASDFDAVIEPGELAHEYDDGPTTELYDSIRIDPVTLLSGTQVLTRGEARRRLRYRPDEKVVLVTLGAGNINDIGSLQDLILEWFAREAPDWRVVMTKPPIAAVDSSHGVETLEVYPLAEYTRAFDFSVSAAGYNAFHEWMLGGLPTLWIPNDGTRTDDQVARARWAEDQGLGLFVREQDSTALPEALQRMTSLSELVRMKQQLSQLPQSNGGSQAADLLMGGNL